MPHAANIRTAKGTAAVLGDRVCAMGPQWAMARVGPSLPSHHCDGVTVLSPRIMQASMTQIKGWAVCVNTCTYSTCFGVVHLCALCRGAPILSWEKLNPPRKSGILSSFGCKSKGLCESSKCSCSLKWPEPQRCFPADTEPITWLEVEIKAFLS